MKTVASSLGLLLLAGALCAQERLPQEDAQRFAKIFVEHAAKLTDAQVKTDVDADKPCCVTKGESGAMIIPDKTLTADVLAKAGKDVTPVGQLWMRKVAPVDGTKAIANDKLRVVTVSVKNEDHQLYLSYVGVRKKGDGLELVLFGKDKEPVLTLPLEKAEATQELPIEMEAMKGDGDTATVTLNVLGKYKAKLTVTPQEP